MQSVTLVSFRKLKGQLNLCLMRAAFGPNHVLSLFLFFWGVIETLFGIVLQICTQLTVASQGGSENKYFVGLSHVGSATV